MLAWRAKIAPGMGVLGQPANFRFPPFPEIWFRVLDDGSRRKAEIRLAVPHDRVGTKAILRELVTGDMACSQIGSVNGPALHLTNCWAIAPLSEEDQVQSWIDRKRMISVIQRG